MVGASEFIDYYMDPAQVFRIDRYMAAWSRADHSKNADVAHYESKDLWYYDCPGRKAAVKSWVNYDRNGKVSASQEVKDYQLDWVSVVPGSVGESRFEVVCNR